MEQKKAEADVSIVEEISQIMFTNFLLLGMKVDDMESNFKIAFKKEMFNLPNKVGAEAVLHFLFFRLNPSLADEKFRDCWPVIDKKREMLFRKICNSWIVSIQKNAEDAHLPKHNPALLLAPGGKKFIHLICSLSTFVLTHVMKNEHDWKSSITFPQVSQSNKSSTSAMLSSIKDNTMLEMKDFFKYLHLMSGANRSWKACSDELVKEYRGLTKKLRDIEHEKRQLVNLIMESANRLGCPLPAKRTLTMFDSDVGPLQVKRGQRIEQVRSQWKTLKNTSDFFSNKREIVQSIVDKTVSNQKLDGTNIGVCVPGLLLREFKKEIQQQQIDNVYVGGRLSLIPVLKMWNLCLRRYLEQIKSEALPEVSKEIPDLTGQTHKHHSFFKDIYALRDELTSVIIPELEESIQQLREKLKTKDFGSAQSALGLELTNPMSPQTATHNAQVSGNSSQFSDITFQYAQKADTPDAVAAVMEFVASKTHPITKMEPTDLAHTFENLIQSGQASQSTSKKPPKTVKRKIVPLKSATERSNQTNPLAKDAGKKVSGPSTSLKQSSNQSKTGIQKPPINSSKQKERSNNAFGLPLSTKGGKATATQQKAKVFELLANSIVDSVISDDVPSLNFSSDIITPVPSMSESSSPLSKALAAELDISAFISHDLLKRSPLEPEPDRNEMKQKSKKSPPLPAETRPSLSSSSITPSRPTNIRTSANISQHSQMRGAENSALPSTDKETLQTSLDWASPKSIVKTENSAGVQLPKSVSDFSILSESTVAGDNAISPFDAFFEGSGIQQTTIKHTDDTTMPVGSKSFNRKLSSSNSPPFRSDVSELGLTFNPPTPQADSSCSSVKENGKASPSLPSKAQSTLRGNRRMGNSFGAKGRNDLLGDRPCGDGEASEEFSLPARIAWASDDNDINTRNLDLSSSEEEDSGQEESDNDFALPLISSLALSNDPSNVVFGASAGTGEDESSRRFLASVSEGKATASAIPSSLLLESDVMEGLVDLVDSDVDVGLNDSFAPLKQGIQFDNVPTGRTGHRIFSPLTKPIKVTSSVDSPSLLSTPCLRHPSVNSSCVSWSGQTGIAERLLQLQAETAFYLEESDDD